MDKNKVDIDEILIEGRKGGRNYLSKPDISQGKAGKKQVENGVYRVPKKRLHRLHKSEFCESLKMELATSWQR